MRPDEPISDFHKYYDYLCPDLDNIENLSREIIADEFDIKLQEVFDSLLYKSEHIINDLTSASKYKRDLYLYAYDMHKAANYALEKGFEIYNMKNSRKKHLSIPTSEKSMYRNKLVKNLRYNN